MSTISFPDWINSLSPQSTDGKDIYQQDGSTPSRGDLDDKASLSGGADANFALMPQVGGSPILERDSNSDGEWVRFSDGSQICTSSRNYDFSGLRSQVYEYPNTFISQPSGSISFLNTTQPPRIDAFKDTFVQTATAAWRVVNRGTVEESLDVFLFAFGKWK